MTSNPFQKNAARFSTNTGMDNNKKHFFIILVLIGITGVAFILRIYRIGATSMWEDEITRVLNSTFYAKDFTEVVQLASTQSQPPLSYWINRIFLFSALDLGLVLSDALVRIPSLLFGVLSVPIFFFLVRDWFGSPYDYVASVLLAISALSIRYSQEVGSIALWLLLTIMEFYLFVKAIHIKQIKIWLLTCLIMILSIYTHIFAAITISLQLLVLGLLWLWRRLNPRNAQVDIQNRDLFLAGLSSFFAVLMFSFLLNPILSASTRFMQGLEMSIIDFLRLVINALLPFSSLSIGTLIIFFLVIIGLLEGIRQKKLEGGFLAAMVIGFPIVEYLAFVYKGLSYFNARYVIVSLPFYIIAFILGVSAILRISFSQIHLEENVKRKYHNLLLLGSLMVTIFLSLTSLTNVYKPHKQDWRGLTSYLEDHLDRNDILFFTPDYFSQYYYYYNSGKDNSRTRYQPNLDDGWLNDIYWVTNSDSSDQFRGLPLQAEYIENFSSNLYLWKLSVGKKLNHLYLINQDFSIKISNGSMHNSPLGWSVTEGELSVVQQTDLQGGKTVLQFSSEQKNAAVTSFLMHVTPQRGVKLSANIKTEQLNKLGALVGFYIKDRNGNTIATYRSDSIGGNHDWTHLTAGGIIPADGYSLQAFIRIMDVPLENAQVFIKDIQVFGDWEDPSLNQPLQETQIPDFVDQGKLNEFWKIPVNNKLDLHFEKDDEGGNEIVALHSLEAGVDLISSSPRVQIDPDRKGYFYFSVDVKIENLQGEKGIEIAIGWVDENGKIIKWSESKRVNGTKNWERLDVIAAIPANATQFILIPLRWFDSQGPGEKVWIRNPMFYTQGNQTIPVSYTTMENSLEVEIPDLIQEYRAGSPNSFWKIASTSLVRCQLFSDETNKEDQTSLMFTTNGPNVDYIVKSERFPIESDSGSSYIFMVDIRTENLVGVKGVEIAIGWIDAQGRNMGWSESQLINGTNDWETIQVDGKIPEGAVEMTLVPLRIFDSASAEEKVWVRSARLFRQSAK